MKRLSIGIITLFTIPVLLLFIPLQLSAQEIASNNGEGENGSLAEPEVANYLDRHRAVRRVEQLQQMTILDIQRLKILVANFGSEVSDAQGDFEKIKELYRQAQEKWYKRRYVESLNLHNDAREIVVNLFKKISVLYQQDVSEMLDDCSTRLVDAEFSQSLEPGQRNDISKTIAISQQKLKIAYQQTALAEDMLRENRYSDAIKHYRLAKIFAIDVIRDLEMDPAKKQEIDTTYRVHLLDSRGIAVDNSGGGGNTR